MKHSPQGRKNWWVLVGVALLCLFWLAFIPVLISGPTIGNIVMMVIFTAFCVGIITSRRWLGRLGSKKPGIKMKPGPEPAYPSQPDTKPTRPYKGFWGKLREKMRDKTRDELCAYLCTMGLDARMAERRRPEEHIWKLAKSLGLIAISDSPIRWVNVCEFEGGQYTSTTYRNVYLVPDPRVAGEGYLELKSVRVKSKPVFGEVVDLRWQAKFVFVERWLWGRPALEVKRVPLGSESDLVTRLNDDSELKERLTMLKEDVKIRSYPSWGWAIESGHSIKQPMLSREQWNCYETIARHLLESGGK